jgi:hypothetical protein
MADLTPTKRQHTLLGGVRQVALCCGEGRDKLAVGRGGNQLLRHRRALHAQHYLEP